MLPRDGKHRPLGKFAVESFDRNTHVALGNRDDLGGIEGPIHSADPVARASSAGSTDSTSPGGDFATSGSVGPGDLCQVDDMVFRTTSRSECVAQRRAMRTGSAKQRVEKQRRATRMRKIFRRQKGRMLIKTILVMVFMSNGHATLGHSTAKFVASAAGALAPDCTLCHYFIYL
jgi:hypothetical protein